MPGAVKRRSLAATRCAGAPSGLNDLYPQIDGCGAHEVIVESPRHVAGTSDLSADELAEVLLAYQMRLVHWKRDPRMVYGQIFRNVGRAAGASLEHTHSQLLVIPRVPHVVAAEMAAALSYYDRCGRCPFCDMIHSELAGGQRIVAESAHHLSFAPFAARLPFETWILPKHHASPLRTGVFGAAWRTLPASSARWSGDWRPQSGVVPIIT